MGIKAIRIARGLLGAAFLSLLGMPGAALATHTAGHTVWGDVCAGCHGATPAGHQLNAAGTGGTSGSGPAGDVLTYVISVQASMKDNLSLKNLTRTQRDDVAKYIASELTAYVTSTAMNIATTVNIGSNLYIGGVAFSNAATCTGPTSGTLSGWTAGGGTATATYTPAANFVGPVTFTYRGDGPTPGQCRTATVKVGSVPVITSPTTRSGQVGVAMSSYTITATNNPSSYGRSGTFPTGLGVTQSGSVISFSGTPTAAGTFTPSVTATNYWGTDSNVLTFTIAKGNQTITFGQPTTPVTYSPGGTFLVSATASSGLTVVFTSGTTGVCTVSGTTVSLVGAGTCTLNANQAGNANYNAASQVSRNVTVSQASQTITFTQPATPISYSTGGTFGLSASSTSGLIVALTSTTPGVCSVAGTTATILTAGLCTIAANQAGDVNYTAAAQVTRSVTINGTVPGAPGIGTGTAGDAQATIGFTAPTNNGGSTITLYTATCAASGQTTRTGSAASSPIVVGSLTNAVMYSCSVTATNATGTGSASGTVAVTPSQTPTAPAITSVNNAGFVVFSSGTFTITASGFPAPTFSVVSGTFPPGVSLTSGVISGIPTTGTAGTYNLTLRASNSEGSNDQAFTLTVGKASQSINFTGPANQGFSLATTPLSASASPSGLTVSFASATPAVCSLSGANVTLLAVGDCTINANQTGSGDYSAATQVSRTFTISKGTQTLSFAAQTPASRAFDGGTFAVSPVATASSGLPVSHVSTTTAVCVVSGTTVTLVGVGTCAIQASQSGDGNWNAASSVSQVVTITQGAQSITFAATQAAQSFRPGGTFAIDPVGLASSGLAISYTTLTPAVCTVSGTTITILAVGTCMVAANQEGNSNYAAAAQATRNITINASVPDAPTIESATPTASAQATVTFTGPANDGGSAITGYTASCSASAQPTQTASGPSSPLVVTGLTNGVQYSCSVAATNAVGTGSSSASLTVTPSGAGPQLWSSKCSACHGLVPAGARFNAAAPVGSTTPPTLPISVLNHVIATQPTMQLQANLQALTDQEREDIVAYITGFMPATEAVTAPNVAKTFGLANLIVGTISFTDLEVISSSSGGFASDASDGTPSVVGTMNGSVTVYGPNLLMFVPNANFTGVETFTYRGINVGAGFQGSLRTATITVSAANPVLSVSLAGAGTGTAGVVSPQPSGLECPSYCQEAYVPGTMVTLSAAAGTGSVFSGWSGACSGTGDCTLTMDAAKSVVAMFDAQLFNLAVGKSGAGAGTVTSSPAGISCGATCDAAFDAGNLVALTATPATGSVFGGWSGACSGTGVCVVTMNAAKAVGAAFQVQMFTLSVGKVGAGTGTVTSSAPGIVCGSSCAFDYVYDTSLTLTATPASGSSFAGWSGACAGGGTCNITMQGARSATATFNTTAVPASVDLAIAQSISPNPPIAGSDVSITLTVTNNGPDTATGVTLTDTVPGGASFISASAGCINSSGTVSCSLGSLVAGASTQVTIVVRPLSEGSFANNASVTATEGDSSGSNNTSSVVVAVASPDPPRLVGISTRMQVLTADNVMIAGFIIGGSVAKTVVVRARGPSLGVAGALNDPTLTLVPGSGPATMNDDWGTAANAAALAASGYAPSNPKESAIMATLAPGAYTAIVSGVGNATGVAIVEVYELDDPEIPMIAISTRGFVQTADNVMIGGFIIQGSGPQTVVIRARGPSLGVAGSLGDPTLTLVPSSGPAITNDDWGTAANAATLSASGFAPSHPKESAILITLNPGAYTAIVSGVGGTTGVAIVEVYTQ